MVIQTTLMGAGIISLLILLLFSLVILLVLKVKRRKFELSIWNRLPETMNPGLPLEERFKAIFGLIDRMIKTEDAYVYLLDREGKALVQRISKGGLVPGEGKGKILGNSHIDKETVIRLPKSIAFLERDELPGIITQGAAKFFSVPLVSSDGFEGTIRIGPIFVRHTKSLKRNGSLLSSLAVPFSLIIKEGLVLDKAMGKVAELGALSEIERMMIRSAFELEEFFGLLLGVAISEIKADGGLVFVSQEAKPIKVSKGIPLPLLEKMDSVNSVEGSLASFNLIARRLQGDGIAVLIKEKGKPVFDESNRRLLEVFAQRMELALNHAHSFKIMLDDYLDTLKTLVKTMDTRDPLTKEHSERIALYAGLIAGKMGLADDEIKGVKTAALLHDVGMCGIADQIINKPGKYTDYEYEIMKNHAQIGACMVEPIKQPVDLAPLIRGHHERYDGWGYPDGLRGKNIPLGARIIGLVDSFNAKVEKRSYRDPLPLEKAIEQIESASGTQFDPEVVKAFLKCDKKKLTTGKKNV